MFQDYLNDPVLQNLLLMEDNNVHAGFVDQGPSCAYT